MVGHSKLGIRMHFIKRVSAQNIAILVGIVLLATLSRRAVAEPVNGWVTASGTPTLTEAGAGQLQASWGGVGIALYAPFGTNSEGYALAPGYRLTFSGFITNTSFNWGNEQFRFGLFSNNGEAPDVVSNWIGYWIPNVVGGTHSDAPHKRLAGHTNGFWELGRPLPVTISVGSPVAATGAAVSGSLPNGVYEFSLMLSRLDATNLNITWELENISDRSGNPVRGIYSFSGTATDSSPSGWTFNRAMLFTGHNSGAFSCGELTVTFGKNTPVVAALAPKSGPASAALLETQPPKAAPEKNSVLPVATPPEPGGGLWVILTGLIGIIGLLIWGIVIVKRLAHNAMLAQESKALLIGDDTSATPEVWRQRALAAEALAAKQTQILDEKVGPELREFAKEALVQGLYHQRNALMETQKRAQQALTELETRLSELHLPLHERILAYEKRIAELEKELETRGEEMRELTKATLLLVKQKLEQERELSEPRYGWE